DAEHLALGTDAARERDGGRAGTTSDVDDGLARRRGGRLQQRGAERREAAVEDALLRDPSLGGGVLPIRSSERVHAVHASTFAHRTGGGEIGAPPPGDIGFSDTVPPAPAAHGGATVRVSFRTRARSG